MLGEALEDNHLYDELSPIDDARGSADYRREAAGTLIRRGLAVLGERLGRQP